VLNVLIENEIIDTQFVLETLDTFWDQFFTFKHRPSISIWSMKQNNAPYFIEYVRQDLEKTFGEDLIKQGGLRIYTTLNLEINRMADKALIEGLNYQDQRTREIIGEVDQSVEGAITTIDPKNGHILVMIGGRGFTMDNQFNRVISAKRQIGSAFKPFVYAVAFESNEFQPDSEIEDKPIIIQTENELWKPSNYNNTYYGRVTLEFALKKSLNSVAVQLAQETGSEKIIKLIGNALDLEREQILRRFKPYPSIALGVYSFSPLEVVRAYAIFPNHGEKIFPISILRVEDTAGMVVLDNEGEQKKAETVYDLYDNLQIIEKGTAETINTMLKEVIKRGGTAYQAILASGLVIEGSGKTGTTDNYTDAWFIGYTEDMVTAVWVGFDDPRHSLGKGQAGGIVAAPIWASFMKQALWRD
jgi:penicillin-binding protein 1A